MRNNKKIQFRFMLPQNSRLRNGYLHNLNSYSGRYKIYQRKQRHGTTVKAIRIRICDEEIVVTIISKGTIQ